MLQFEQIIARFANRFSKRSKSARTPRAESTSKRTHDTSATAASTLSIRPGSLGAAIQRWVTVRRQSMDQMPFVWSTIEELELRTMLSTTTATPYYVVDPLIKAASAAPPTSAFTPAQIRHAYGIDNIVFGDNAGDGTGQTIAIVDAYDDPGVVTDLQTFSTQFNLPTANLTVLNQRGGTTRPSTDPAGPGDSWAGEISLDVQWVHAIAPYAKILLIETDSNALDDLFAGVDIARNYADVSVVSMSFGGGEFLDQTIFDSHFVTPAGHIGVSFFASTGDDGAGVSYPSSSPNVIAVGGTSLFTSDSSGTYASESAWSGSGGGISDVTAKPFYQNSLGASTTNRAVPDIAAVADPETGVAVVDSYDNPASSPWMQIGGTSLSSPVWAALTAIVNQGRVLQSLPTLDGPTQTLPQLYSLASSNFHDITTGTSGNPATIGYDLVTGIGTPIADKFVLALSGFSDSSHIAFSSPEFSSRIDGANVIVTVTRSNLTSNAVTVDYTTTDATARGGLNYTPTSGTLSFAAGDISETITIPITAASSGQGNLRFNIILSNVAGNGIITGGTTATVDLLDNLPNDDGQYINSVYINLLDRGVDGASLAQIQPALDSARGPALNAVTTTILNSLEYYQHVVTEDFLTYLHRGLSAAELDNYVSRLVNGTLTHDQEIVAIVSSDEYFARRANKNNLTWVRDVYEDLLGRDPDTAGQTGFLKALAARTKRSVIVNDMMNSDERLTRFINTTYVNILHRSATDSEVSSWLSKISTSFTDDKILAAVLGSVEAVAYNGNTSQTWLAFVYNQLLGRAIDANGQNQFGKQILDIYVNARAIFINQILTSQEYKMVLVTSYYNLFLHRPPTSSELAASTDFLNRGGTTESMAASIAATDEYYATAGGGTPATFLNQLYQDILGRPVDAAGQAQFSTYSFDSSAIDRNTAAYLLLTSAEGQSRYINSIAALFLNRPASAAELSIIVPQLINGTPQASVILGLGSTTEAFARSQTGGTVYGI